MRRRLALLLLLLEVAILTGSGACAQQTPPTAQVVFWSAQGPVAVDRALDLAPAHAMGGGAEELLQELVKGPTTQEMKRGLRTAIPQGTQLAAVLELGDDTVVVRFDVPRSELEHLTHEEFEAIVQQVGKTLLPVGWSDLRIQVRDPETGDFVSLADFLPDIEVPKKPSSGAAPEVSGADSAAGQPAAPGQGQPTGSLSGKTVYVSAGHGWEWNSYKNQWKTQRPPYPTGYSSGPIIEDHNNGEAVNQYLLHYLWNAGAKVFPVRERDLNPNEVIVDDSDAGFSHSGWTYTGDGYRNTSHWVNTVTGSATHMAEWQAALPAGGRYAVYVWYEAWANRTSDARYTVHHSGGETTVSVNQREHGYTWHYIGTYGFEQGPARVTLTNQSGVAGQAVIADAVRFGGGRFNSLSGMDTVATSVPNKPWWEVASFYYAQKMGMPAGYGDVTVRPTYARWEHAGTGDEAVYVSWHTNGATGTPQWSYSGTETYAHNNEGLQRTAGSLALRDAIHNEVVHDIRAGWDASWIDRGRKVANLGELRLLWDDDPEARMPGALIEIGFHDHPGDTDQLKDPRFNQLVARAVYQGIAKYFNASATLLPEPPEEPAVENVGGGAVRVSWLQSPTDGSGLAGHGATGYRVYTSGDGIGWSNGVTAGNTTEHVIEGLSGGQLLFVRVTATNAGGESFPTETLAVRVGDTAELLLVNGFDRLNHTMTVYDNDPVEGVNYRMYLDQMNRYDYVVQHAKAIDAVSEQAFDSSCNEAVAAGRVNLSSYTIVDWILGEESTGHQTLNSTERGLVRGFTENDGALFISGSEIGYHLDYAGADPDFYNNVLRADYGGDDAGTYDVYGTSGDFAGLGSFHFRESGMYDPDYPDRLHAVNGSVEVLRYQGGSGGTAAVQYVNPHNDCERLVYFGFPFETVQVDRRNAVMGAVLGFLDECLHSEVDTSIESPVYGSAHNSRPAFSGEAHADHATLNAVEVQIESNATGAFWNGSNWVATAVWIRADGASNWSYSLPAGLPDGTYHLRARGKAHGDLLDETPAESLFTYDTTPPAPTTLTSPSDGAVVTGLPELRLDWADVGPDGGTPLHYRVCLDEQCWVVTDSFYALPHVTAGHHQWRVRVEDAAGNTSAWTPLGHFTVRGFQAWLPAIVRSVDDRQPGCTEMMVNGDFEAEGGWEVNPEGFEIYTSDRAHGGLRSAFVGYDETPYSSIRQSALLPSGSTGTLRLWLYRISEGQDPDDWQYVSLWDERGDRHNLEFLTSDAQEWQQAEYDVTDFLGQRITVIIGAINDGDGNLTRAYIDDVELEVCP